MDLSVLHEKLEGVWSATPTPFDDDLRVDEESVARMVEHHLKIGVKGLFLAGTCGEGPWMTDAERSRLVRAVVAAAQGRLAVAVQVTDNSAGRIIDNMHRAAEAGADLAVIAPPFFLMNPTAENLTALYTEAIEACPLPVGIYDRGTHGAVQVPAETLDVLYRHPRVVAVKDSSTNPERRAIALAARAARPGLRLLSGDEFKCVEYIAAGYDGLMLGGGIMHAHLANALIAAVRAGDIATGQAIEERMIRIMHAVYGGETFACWLSGLKKLLVEMGVFRTWRSFLRYPLTDECSAAIAAVLRSDADALLPYRM